MSLWKFQSAVNGWMRANGVQPQAKPPTEDRHDYLMAKYA